MLTTGNRLVVTRRCAGAANVTRQGVCVILRPFLQAFLQSQASVGRCRWIQDWKEAIFFIVGVEVLANNAEFDVDVGPFQADFRLGRFDCGQTKGFGGGFDVQISKSHHFHRKYIKPTTKVKSQNTGKN